MAGEKPNSPITVASRKRACQACLACRARKVRCDVTQCGPPCMHCRLDGGNCIVKARPVKYRKNRIHSQPERSFVSSAQVCNLQQATEPSAQTVSVETLPHSNCQPAEDEAASFENIPEESVEELDGGSLRHREDGDPPCAARPFIAYARAPLSTEYVYSTELGGGAVNIGQDSRVNPDTHVLYSYYPFLQLDTLPYMTPEDINFLESQGCFRVPIRPLLDHFVQEYFLHVHPGLPIIDEGVFWEMYTHRSYHPAEHPRITLFVFQAIIFASCCFVSREVIRNLGFSDAQSARAAYYRRAKLLFDFEGDRDSISTAQGALLLSYHPPMRNHVKINTFWLGMALQFAKDAGAHRYYTSESLTPYKKNMMKRLWWCCILRDRIISLGVRRPLQIMSADFGSHQPPLSIEDLESEVGRSKVYDAPTKLSLIQLTVALCELAAILTEVIMLAYPLHGSVDSTLSTEKKVIQSLDRLVPSRSALVGWFKKASMSFPTTAGIGDMHESVLLYANLMYIYYHSAILALSQHEILVSAMGPSIRCSEWHRICRSKNHLEEAASGITDILNELNRLELTKYLPISVVAYVALPLVLHILDVKLATSELQRVRKQGRLKIYTKAMKVLQSQYDGPDELSEIIATMINYVSLEHSMQRPKLNSTDESELSQPRGGHLRAASISTLAMPTGALSAVNDWGGVLLRQPDLYLHFTLTIDLALEKGHFPDHRDFPVALQSRSATTTRFPMYRITMGNMNRIDDSHAHAEKSGRNDQNAGTAKDAPNNEHGINTDVIPTSPTGTLPTTDGFINQMQPVSIDSGNNLNDDLDLPMDFGSFAMAGPDEGDIEFSCASPWLDEMFFTTV